MKRVFWLFVMFALFLGLCSCQKTEGNANGEQQKKGKGFYALVSEDNQGGVMSYTCIYQNTFDPKTCTLEFVQRDAENEVLGYGTATYDKEGRRLTYVLKDQNKNTYLSQEFSYDENGYQSEVYTRMLGSPDSVEYKNYENGKQVGGMLCYYDESGNIESTVIYTIEELEKGSVISYYDSDGTLTGTAGYRETFDDHGNLISALNFSDATFEEQTGSVRYAYEWISIA